jgi:5-methylcytosine-specific restriction endonuclease McrA
MNKPKKAKTGQQLKKILWRYFSEYIRKRDNYTCISCGKKCIGSECHAGHYHPRTDGLSLFFDEKNVNAQCSACNLFRHGNLTQYALALKRKYGDQILEELEWKHRQFIQIHENEYLKFIEIYKQKLREL